MLGLHFTPACVLLSVCSLHFTQSAFYPWSAVCSPQSAVFLLHWPKKLGSEDNPYWRNCPILTLGISPQLNLARGICPDRCISLSDLLTSTLRKDLCSNYFYNCYPWIGRSFPRVVGGGRRVAGGGWRVAGGGWRVTGDGWRAGDWWRVAGDGWRVAGGGLKMYMK